MNQAQARLLTQHNITPEKLGEADPSLRLLWCELGEIADESPTLELNALQREYLGDRALSEITGETDRANLEWLGKLGADIEASKRAAQDAESKPAAPAPLDWRTAVLDSDRLSNKNVNLRLEVANVFEAARRKGPANATEYERLTVEKWARR
jgi:hypothetical protein